jgi:hypothetical protein
MNVFIWKGDLFSDDVMKDPMPLPFQLVEEFAHNAFAVTADAKKPDSPFVISDSFINPAILIP